MGSTPLPHSPLMVYLPEPPNWSLSPPTRAISIRRCGFWQVSARQLFRYLRVAFRLARSKSRTVQEPLAGLAPVPHREQTVTSSPCTRWLRLQVSPRVRRLLMSMPQLQSPLQLQLSAVRTRAEFRPSAVTPLIDACGQGAFRHSPR